MLETTLAMAERAGEWLWRLFWRRPLVGALLWIAIGFELFGLTFLLRGLAGPVGHLLVGLSRALGGSLSGALALVFLGVRVASAHLVLNHTRLNRETGGITSPPLFSADRPAMGRAVLLGLTVALLDAILLHAATLALGTALPDAMRDVARTPVAEWGGFGRVFLAVALAVLQFGCMAFVLWAVDARLANRIKRHIPASGLLLKTRDFANRFRLAVAFDLAIYVPITLALAVAHRDNALTLTVLTVFFLTKIAALAVFETISLGLDWWNAAWIQGLGPRLKREKDPAQRLLIVERMARLGALAGPVWPELPAVLHDSDALGALSQRLLQLGVQFAACLTEGQWDEARGVGEIILQWYPDTRMACLVREQMTIMQRVAAIEHSQLTRSGRR